MKALALLAGLALFGCCHRARTERKGLANLDTYRLAIEYAHTAGYNEAMLSVLNKEPEQRLSLENVTKHLEQYWAE